MISRARYEPGGRDAALTAATVRRLTDPLGASGQRRTGERIRRERGARRALFAAAVGSFLAILGSLALGATPEQDTPSANANVVWAIDSDGNIQAVRIVEREIAQIRTRSS
jgi:hypothetical protein